MELLIDILSVLALYEIWIVHKYVNIYVYTTA